MASAGADEQQKDAAGEQQRPRRAGSVGAKSASERPGWPARRPHGEEEEKVMRQKFLQVPERFFVIGGRSSVPIN